MSLYKKEACPMTLTPNRVCGKEDYKTTSQFYFHELFPGSLRIICVNNNRLQDVEEFEFIFFDAAH